MLLGMMTVNGLKNSTYMKRSSSEITISIFSHVSISMTQRVPKILGIFLSNLF